jgi:hypothetical protein
LVQAAALHLQADLRWLDVVDELHVRRKVIS